MSFDEEPEGCPDCRDYWSAAQEYKREAEKLQRAYDGAEQKSDGHRQKCDKLKVEIKKLRADCTSAEALIAHTTRDRDRQQVRAEKAEAEVARLRAVVEVVREKIALVGWDDGSAARAIDAALDAKEASDGG